MSKPTKRRNFLKGLGATGAAVTMGGLAGCLGDDDGVPTDETITIGAVQPVSGGLQYYGQISLMGFYSGLAYKYDDVDPVDHFEAGSVEVDPEDGPTYEIILADTTNDVSTAQSEASDLVVDEEVDLLFGTSNSGAARRIVDEVVDPTDTPFIIGPAADANITNDSENCHQLVFRASENTAMDARAGAVYAAEELGMERVKIMAADYEFGYSVESNYRSVLEEAGIEVLESRYVEQGHTEFDGLFEAAENEGADGVVGGFTFLTLPAFLTTGMAYDVQLFGGLAALVTAQAIGPAVTEVLGDDFTAEDAQEAGLGPFTTRYHWNQYENSINDEFIEMHTDAYGIVPDLFSSGTFVGATALVEAIEDSGSTDGADIADSMRGMTVQDTPKGEDAYTFQEFNNQASSSMSVAWLTSTTDEWADNWDAPVMPGEPVETIPAEDAMTPAEDASCSLD